MPISSSDQNMDPTAIVIVILFSEKEQIFKVGSTSGCAVNMNHLKKTIAFCTGSQSKHMDAIRKYLELLRALCKSIWDDRLSEG